MRRMFFASIFLASALVLAGCSMISAVAPGNNNLTTVTELWSDVPKMDGLTPSKMEMPLYLKVLMTTAFNGVLGEGKDSGDWAVFSTSKTPDDVKSYYTNDRMTADGWAPSQKSTCLNGSDSGIAQVGVFCVFTKQQADKQIGLMIIASADSQTKQTNVLFVRVQAIGTPVPGQ